MQRTFAAAILCGLALISARVPADEKATPKHLADARDLVKHLDLEHTSYKHGAAEVTWTGTRESHADCSGFVDALLTHTYGYDREQFKKWFDSHRPSAARYHDAIVDQRGFTEIAEVPQIRPGDLLAVKYLKRKDNTGHMMLVAEAPRRMQAKQPLVDGTDQWEVAIIDSSETGHGPSDTRHKKGPGGKDHDGLGEGVVRLYTDKQGKVAGFAWSTLAASHFKAPDDEHLVAGRWKPDFKP